MKKEPEEMQRTEEGQKFKMQKELECSKNIKELNQLKINNGVALGQALVMIDVFGIKLEEINQVITKEYAQQKKGEIHLKQFVGTDSV